MANKTLEELYEQNTAEYEILKNSLEYGTAVNTDRSIPDAKSGLKPVARRILYDAFIENRISSKPHVKSARIVGDVMGRFHPHGDSSIYGAMVRLSQDWVMRYPLIDIHGNNGTILGDGPAAMRYTEARLSKISEDGMLKNLKKNPVEFIPTFDESEEEPVTLPAIFPNLLCNPNEGIGWAMGCSWAPHNLNEVSDAIIQYLNGEEPSLPGPDFPTGGIIINKDDIPNIMKTGRGSVKIRGKYSVDGNNITFYEIPYGTRVETLMDEISKACDEEKINGISDIRNETGKKTGIKLVIQIEKGASLKYVINQLFSKTSLQTAFSYNQIALIGKTPTELNLKSAIEVYVNHNIECITKEAQFDLNKASGRKHVIDGLLKALEDIDNVINLIKKSESSTKAKENLIIKYNLDEIQAKAILDMKLSRLAKLEKIELENENKELEKIINDLNSLISNKDKQILELKSRLSDIVKKYGDARRTELTQISENKDEKEIANVEPEKVVVVMTKDGLIKRIPTKSFKVQKRNGKGVKTPNDIVSDTIRTNTIDQLMVFTNLGRMYKILVDDIPVGTNSSKGTPVKALIEMLPNEEPTLIYSIYRDTDAKYVFFTTKNGLVKKTALDDYCKTKKKSGIVAITIQDGDALASVNLVKEEDMVLITHLGMSIRFDSTDVGASSRTAQGMRGINLKDKDYVITALPVRHDTDYVAIISENGLGKKFKLSDLNRQKKAGKGLMCYKPSKNSGNVAAAALVDDSDSLLIAGDKSSICISASDLPPTNRGALGNVILKDNTIQSITKV